MQLRTVYLATSAILALTTAAAVSITAALASTSHPASSASAHLDLSGARAMHAALLARLRITPDAAIARAEGRPSPQLFAAVLASTSTSASIEPHLDAVSALAIAATGDAPGHWASRAAAVVAAAAGCIDTPDRAAAALLATHPVVIDRAMNYGEIIAIC